MTAGVSSSPPPYRESWMSLFLHTFSEMLAKIAIDAIFSVQATSKEEQHGDPEHFYAR